MKRAKRERIARKDRLARELKSLMIYEVMEAADAERIMRWIRRLNISELREMIRIEQLDPKTASENDLLYRVNVRTTRSM